MNEATPRLHTATRIAHWLRRSRQSVHLQFADKRPDGLSFIRGQRANGWKVDSFPADVRASLEALPCRPHHSSLDEMLAAPPTRYECRVPLAEIAPEVKEKAFKLREVLRPFLKQSANADACSEDVVRRGLESYRLVFGYAVSAKTWRTKFAAIVHRDAGNEEWDRLDLYLPENPARLSLARPTLLAREHSLEILEETVAELVRLGPLNVERKDQLWTRACDQLQLAIEEGAKEKKVKRAILKVLVSSGLLGADKETIRRNLNHHWKQFVAGGAKAFVDRRRQKPKDHLSEEETDKLAGISHVKGSIAAGFKSAIENVEGGRYTDSSRVPPRILRAVSPRLQSIASCAKDLRSERSDGPSHIGDYSRLFAGEKMEMDDWTPECLCFEYLPTGRPRFFQGQIILLSDVASRRVLQWSFTEGAYSALQIRATLVRGCAETCLPDLLNLENGLWKRAKLIVGSKVIGDIEWEMGVREFIKVNHAKRPQGKGNLEKLFDQIGILTRKLPAWCGRDMRVTMPRDLQAQVAHAESGKLDPRSFCLTKEQMMDALAACVAEYNATPQPYSKKLCGLSPNEAWNAKQSPEGRPSLGREAAYLFAYHREPITIKKCQIEKTTRGVQNVYHSPLTARFDRQRVLLWWNPEDLSQVAFSSLDRKQGPFVIRRQDETPVLAKPDYAAIGAVQKTIDETLKARHVIYKSCEPWILKTRLRPTLTDRPTADFGKELETGVAKAKAQQTTQQGTVARATRLVRSSGINVRVDQTNAARLIAAAELLASDLEDDEL